MINQVTTSRHILEEIVSHKRQEVAQMQQELPLASLRQQLNAAPTVRNFLTALQENPSQPSLIAEVKKHRQAVGLLEQILTQ